MSGVTGRAFNVGVPISPKRRVRINSILPAQKLAHRSPPALRIKSQPAYYEDKRRTNAIGLNVFALSHLIFGI
jgi:hypothetical protein